MRAQKLEWMWTPQKDRLKLLHITNAQTPGRESRRRRKTQPTIIAILFSLTHTLMHPHHPSKNKFHPFLSSSGSPSQEMDCILWKTGRIEVPTHIYFVDAWGAFCIFICTTKRRHSHTHIHKPNRISRFHLDFLPLASAFQLNNG